MSRSIQYTSSPLLASRTPVWRSKFVVGAIALAFLGLAARAAYIQVVANDFFIDQGKVRFMRTLELPANRGRILDRNGLILASSVPAQSIWAIPEDVAIDSLDKQKLQRLSQLLEMPLPALTKRLENEDKTFVWLKRQVDDATAKHIAALQIEGIYQREEYRREYPEGESAVHVVGFTNVEDMGQEGVELTFNQELSGRNGSRRVIKDRRGNIVEDVESVQVPQEGKDITLALDTKIQYLAYASLKKSIAEQKAKAGGIVVLDARNGEILALANFPTYNPNNRHRLIGAQLRNRALTDTFEPGSTMKPFTAALALDKGKVRFDTPIPTAPGKLTIGTATISDAHVHGTLTVAQVIQKSSNIGAAKLALSMTSAEMWDMFDRVGFGTPIKLGFPGEVGGRLRPAKTWKPIEQATMSYGHGISVTWMQMARADQVFARDGDIVPLSLTRLDNQPVSGQQIFSAQTAREVRAMLEMAVQPGGTAPRAQIPGYRVAGKTGTAHKIEGGAYADKYVSSFVGFGPVSDPRLIVAVMVDEPSAGRHYGGDVAAPVFAEVMAGALRTLGVPTDAPLKPLVMANVETVKEGM